MLPCGTTRKLIFMTTLQDLWLGNIRPNEDKVITSEEKELIQLIARYLDTLSSSLKNDDFDVLENILNALPNIFR